MAGTLFGLPLSQRHDLVGAPPAGGRLYIFTGGTTTSATAYKDFALTAPRPIRMFIPGGPADPSYRRSVSDRRSPSATAGHAIDPPAGGANVTGFAEPTTLITGLIGDRAMARARSTHATAAPLARWSRAYAALARQPSARTMAGFEMASRNLANTMSARLGTSFTPADILRAMQGPVQPPAEEE